MKFIIDGYNLLYFVRKNAEGAESLTLTTLVEMINTWAATGRHEILTVFDGRKPPNVDTGLAGVYFVGPDTTADDVMIEFIESYSAPKLLAVVSNDNEICRAGRRRRCKCFKCDLFWPEVMRVLSRKHRVREPREKRTGLAGDQTNYWLEQFGLVDDK